MAYPNIKFQISAKKDLETLRIFIREADERNLYWLIFNTYPRLIKYFDKKNDWKVLDDKALRDFVIKNYKTRKGTMSRAMRGHKMRWLKVAPRYFELVDALFAGRKWPRGKHIAFGTIWGMYPRFLEDKTFQIPFSHRTAGFVSVVIAHEMLHFMFYDYFYEHYPKYKRDEDNFFVWHISEIFNTLVQNSPEWLRCFKVKSLGYPEHKAIVSRLSRTWYRRTDWDLRALIDEIVAEASTLNTSL